MHVYGNKQLIYTGAKVESLDSELNLLFDDISTFLSKDLDITEVFFYYAAMIHLLLAKIHPFADSKGRISRLVEKWFLISKLGEVAKDIPSEKLYQNRIREYYKNLDIGSHYESINMDLCLPFLKMLPDVQQLKQLTFR